MLIKKGTKISNRVIKSLNLQKNKDTEYVLRFKTTPTDDGNRYIEGYASTNDLDRVSDIVTLEALKAVAKQITRKGQNCLLYMHDRNIAVGKVVEARVDSKGLWIKCLISRAESVEDYWIQMKEGVLNSFSIGFRLNDYEIEEKNGLFVSCKILDIEIYEVSIVTVPCNTSANIENVIGKAFTTQKRRTTKMVARKNKVSMKGVMAELLGGMLKKELPAILSDISAKNKKQQDDAAAAELATQTRIKEAVAAALKEAGVVTTKKTKAVATVVKTVGKKPVMKTGKKKSTVDTKEDLTDDDGSTIVKALKNLDDAATIKYVTHLMGDDGAGDYAGLSKDEQTRAKGMYLAMMKCAGQFGKRS